MKITLWWGVGHAACGCQPHPRCSSEAAHGRKHGPTTASRQAFVPFEAEVAPKAVTSFFFNVFVMLPLLP